MKINNYAMAGIVVVGVGFAFLILPIPNRKESVDVLKKVDIFHNPHLISPIISELHRVIEEREPSLGFPDVGGRMSLSNSFQKLQQAGKATTEEVEAINEFEKAVDNLSGAIQRIDSILSLRCEMRL